MHERDLLTHVQERIEFAEGLQHVEAYMANTRNSFSKKTSSGD